MREWQEHSIDRYVSTNPSGWRAIAGQERGTKSEHIRYASQDKYADDHKLMIGDAPGDLKAARDNNALFLPINPGREDESWQRFYEEGLSRFFDGTYCRRL